MRPWAGCAPLPETGTHFPAASHNPPPQVAPEPPAPGGTQRLYRTLPTPVSGVIRKAAPLRQVQSPSAELLSGPPFHRQLAHSPSDHKSPLRPSRPLALPGRSPPPRPGLPSHGPCRVSRSSMGAGCLLSWGGPMVSGAEATGSCGDLSRGAAVKNCWRKVDL